MAAANCHLLALGEGLPAAASSSRLSPMTTTPTGVGFPPISRSSNVYLRPKAGSRTVMVVSETEGRNETTALSKRPIYSPTPGNRELRTPHSGHELMLGNTFTTREGSKASSGEVSPQEFNRRVSEGFQVTPIWHQGFIRDDGRSSYLRTVKTARWEYSTRPVYGWGDVKSIQKSTASWPALLPVFEPHWQICMAGGLSTGWIEWDGQRFEFENAPSYSEKNWGAGFPRRWFWVQCNVFQGVSGEVALTAGGGLRMIPGLVDTYESVALIGVHYGGKFYEFIPWDGVVSWDIAPWGSWRISAENKSFLAELEATTEEPGTALRAPTAEAGLTTACKDSCFADLSLKIWERKYDGSKGELVLDVTSDMAAVEVGGGPWFDSWKGSTAVPEPIQQILRLPINAEDLFPIPFLKPPGL